MQEVDSARNDSLRIPERSGAVCDSSFPLKGGELWGAEGREKLVRYVSTR